MQILNSIENAFRLGKSLEARWPVERDSALSNEFHAMVSDISQNKRSKEFYLDRLNQQLDGNWGREQLVSINVALERAMNSDTAEHSFLVDHKDHLDRERTTFPLTFVLHNIRSSFNVGSVFRTAEAMGAEKIVLSGYTSTPENQKTKKTTMNAHEYIPWTQQNDIQSVITAYREQNYKIYALETAEPNIPISEGNLTGNTLVILGNERFGLDDSVLTQCDAVIRIPLMGVKNSLNVANAASMVMYEYVRRVL
tara:strand:- start:20 stop:778 length:759 start_codon:yes stop_codon:yes gene_type:complete